MQVVRALFDGHDIKPIENIKTKKITEVLVIFPNDAEKNRSSRSTKTFKRLC